MNEANYASLEASKRLVDAGIVLETEVFWAWEDPCSPDDPAYEAYGQWKLTAQIYGGIHSKCIPAPSMAEVWRELPETALQPCRDTTTGYCHEYLSLQKDGDLTVAGYGEYSEIGRNSNPTDALIDLLIWVRKEANHERG